MKQIKQLAFMLALAIAAGIAASLIPSTPQAQGSGAMIVATCGVVPPSYTNIGAVLTITMNTAGKLCQ